MVSQKKKTTNIRPYRTKQEMNIGILIFTVILLYLIITIFTYATSARILPYEVRKGSIVKDNSYTGLILREELPVYAETDGYISYFQRENSKVTAGSNIYAVSSEKPDADRILENQEIPLSDDAQKSLYLKAENFNETFQAQNFSAVYTLKSEYTETLENASSQFWTAQSDAMISGGGNVHVYTSARDGILVRAVDGYESLKEEELKPSDFDKSSSQSVRLENQEEVHAGEPVYKLITSEDWTVYVELDQRNARELSGISSVKARMDKDNETMWAGFSVIQVNGNYYGKLVFDNSMIRYADERYLNVELILEDESGLKIPKSAVTEKDFYVISADYLTAGGSSGSQGVLIKEEDGTVFREADVYYESEEGEVFLNPDDFSQNTILAAPESGSAQSSSLKEKRTLKGVYNINKGYAVFQPVSILCENDDYYIVEEGTFYGPSNYDHIVLDGTTVEDSEVVFQ